MAFYESQITYLENFISDANNEEIVKEMNIKARLENVKASYKKVSTKEYLTSLIGTIGADPLFKKSDIKK